MIAMLISSCTAAAPFQSGRFRRISRTRAIELSFVQHLEIFKPEYEHYKRLLFLVSKAYHGQARCDNEEISLSSLLYANPTIRSSGLTYLVHDWKLSFVLRVGDVFFWDSLSAQEGRCNHSHYLRAAGPPGTLYVDLAIVEDLLGQWKSWQDIASSQLREQASAYSLLANQTMSPFEGLQDTTARSLAALLLYTILISSTFGWLACLFFESRIRWLCSSLMDLTSGLYRAYWFQMFSLV